MPSFQSQKIKFTLINHTIIYFNPLRYFNNKQESYHSQSQMMREFILSVLMITMIVGQTPPTWPLRFQQDFVESYSSTKFNIVGKLWYDAERQMSRLDRNNGKYDSFCSSINSSSTPCTQLVRQGKRYIVFPLLRLCCFCCNSAQGCGILRRDWLRNAKFVGKDTLNGQVFNKFTDEDSKTDYWATTDSKQVPRRLVEKALVFKDFIMNTYSEEYIADNIFALPSYCSETACPKASQCAQISSK